MVSPDWVAGVGVAGTAGVWPVRGVRANAMLLLGWTIVAELLMQRLVFIVNDESESGSEVDQEERKLYAFLYTPDYARTPPKEWPFACVVALHDGEKLISNQWCCLHAFVCEDGTFDFAEGMFGTEKEVTELYGPVSWPEIAKALSVIPQPYRAAFGNKPKLGEMPFERIERWHRHGYSHPKIAPDAEGRALKALLVTKLWDRWTEVRKEHEKSGKENWTFEPCLNDIYDPQKLAALGELKESHGNRLKQFCHNIGLKPFCPSNFEPHMNELETELASIRDRYQITYEKQQVR